MSEFKLAVVGCGYWGKNLARNFSELGVLHCIVDANLKNAEAMAAQYNCIAMSLEDALASDLIKAVVIAAPAEFHAQIALEAIASGKHVYIEKPIALSVEDAQKVKKAAEEANVTLMVGHLLQYHPAFEALLAAVKNGELGKLRYAYSHRLSLGKFRIEENSLWSLAPHDVSMLLALFGEQPNKVSGSGGSFITENIEDEYRLDLEFPSGGRAHIFASWLHPFKEQRLVVVGEKAMAVFEDSLTGPDKLKLYRHEIDTSGAVPAPIKADAELLPFPNGEPLKNECQHFIDACLGKTKVRTDADEAIAVLKVLTKQA